MQAFRNEDASDITVWVASPVSMMTATQERRGCSGPQCGPYSGSGRELALLILSQGAERDKYMLPSSPHLLCIIQNLLPWEACAVKLLCPTS